ncbi:phosphotransferase [Danxiaibacter flavus]|uniref:Phosphotransferase n=1 Tax=Danxiaibacter flavus TaxID=3049108 RepID=A0ABV3ZCE5_9BACT|nr:phosphotransferase [Chitinophagaceae bacterium DXS]
METGCTSSIIPADKATLVASIIQATFGQEASAVFLLKGGLSGAIVYRIVVNGESYVLKLDTPGEEDIYAMNKIAAAAGIAPEIFYADHTQGISISAFIDAKPVRAHFADPVSLAQAMGKLVRKMHDMPVFKKQGDMQGLVNELIKKIKASASAVFAAPAFDETFCYYEQVNRAYPWHDTDKVASHNDLNPNNILFDGEHIRIVDWDAAFANDRYVDLSVAAISFANGAAQENALLEAYFGEALNDYNRARFFLMRQICRIVYAIMMFQLANTAVSGIIGSNPESLHFTMADIGALARSGKFDVATSEGQFYYGIALFNDALNAMRSEQFEPALRLVQSKMLEKKGK